MLLLADIVRKIRALELPPRSFIVIGSCTLAALEIRPTHDVDMTVRRDIYHRLKGRGWSEQVWRGKRLLRHDVYDVGASACYGIPLEELLADALWIDGVPFMNLDRLEAWKRRLNRSKDRHDLHLIRAYRARKRRLVLQR